jgi:CheY-like chemotaxis protein
MAITGYSQAEDYQRTREAEFDDLLFKPFELSALEREFYSAATLEDNTSVRH